MLTYRVMYDINPLKNFIMKGIEEGAMGYKQIDKNLSFAASGS